jgi:DNA-directed RNA polymerase specialized sigma54-like protein
MRCPEDYHLKLIERQRKTLELKKEMFNQLNENPLLKRKILNFSTTSTAIQSNLESSN